MAWMNEGISMSYHAILTKVNVPHSKSMSLNIGKGEECQ